MPASSAGSVPATPFPMTLPDPATAEEIRAEKGIGIAALVVQLVACALVALGIFYYVVLRSWHHSRAGARRSNPISR